jgi:hypothetical protein
LIIGKFSRCSKRGYNTSLQGDITQKQGEFRDGRFQQQNFDHIILVDKIIFLFFFLAFEMSASLDGREIKPIRMPKITSESIPVDVYFELGKIRFLDFMDPENGVLSVTVDEFEERIRALDGMVDSLEEKYGARSDKRVVYCGRKEWKRFFSEAMEMCEQARKKIFVGMPLDTLFEAEKMRKPVTRRSGFETTRSGLIVPRVKGE